MSRLFTILGAGSGQPTDLTRQAREAMAQCTLLLSTDRLAGQLSSLGKIQTCPTGKLAETALAAPDERVGILVSGDTGFFSAAKTLQSALQAQGDVEIVCGLNSMQMLCAKLGISYDDVVWLSLHGRKGSLLGAVSYNRKVFALTGGAQNAQALCQSLVDAGLGGVRVSLGENLGAADERIQTGTAEELAKEPCGNLAVLLIENDTPGQTGRPIYDEDMERGNVPMTKQEARWVGVNLLDLRRDDIVYDIGAGTGSVSMEMARRASVVYAVERSIDGIALIDRNRRELGCFNVLPIEGEAPDVLQGLPAPDAAFIGGSGGTLYETLSLLKDRNPKIRVVVSAVSLETLSDAQIALGALNFEQITVSQISAVRGKKADGSTPFQANNPIYLLYGGPKR